MYVHVCMNAVDTGLWSTGRFHSAWVTSSFASLYTQPGKQSADKRLPDGKSTVYT